jgi:hypothetical protein
MMTAVVFTEAHEHERTRRTRYGRVVSLAAMVEVNLDHIRLPVDLSVCRYAVRSIVSKT